MLGTATLRTQAAATAASAQTVPPLARYVNCVGGVGPYTNKGERGTLRSARWATASSVRPRVLRLRVSLNSGSGSGGDGVRSATQRKPSPGDDKAGSGQRRSKRGGAKKKALRARKSQGSKGTGETNSGVVRLFDIQVSVEKDSKDILHVTEELRAAVEKTLRRRVEVEVRVLRCPMLAAMDANTRINLTMCGRILTL